jgi:hypothetical protein
MLVISRSIEVMSSAKEKMFESFYQIYFMNLVIFV